MDILEKKKVPEVVSLVALGATKVEFFNEAMVVGNKRGVADEVWVINKMGVLVKHDMLFRMDDLSIKYPCNQKEYTGGSIAPGTTIHDSYDDFLKNHDKPIITSQAYPEYPTSVTYPLEEVINFIGYSYFRTTPAYVAAFAAYIGVKQLRIYGCDYVYPTDKYRGEAGRANLEFILGVCMTMGMDVFAASKSTLLDTNIPTAEKMYGYKDPLSVIMDPEDKDRYKVVFKPELGEKLKKEKRNKEKAQLQELITEYKDEVKHDLIEGKWITKDDIDEHEKQKLEKQQLLDAPRDKKGRFKKKKESHKGD